MLLSELIGRSERREPMLLWEQRTGDLDPQIHGLKLDSRRVGAGDMFLCVPGQVVDGHSFAQTAVEQGASAVLVERWLDVSVPQVRVTSTRRAMAWVSAVHAGDPSQQLAVVGVTGTNGKTTVAHLVKAILDHSGTACGLIGTLTGARTTPEAPHLQAALQSMVSDGFQAVAMEVSSHALDQDRVTGTTFNVGVFTNLTADHLDYHGSFEDYFDAKAKLFRSGMTTAAVINEEDQYGQRLLAELDIPCVPYSRDLAVNVEARLDGTSFSWRGQPVELALPGLFNLENALGAAEATRLLGLDTSAIAAGLSAAGQVAGRFEVVIKNDRTLPTVIVDYSHTPAGIENVLESVAAVAPEARRTVVFGAGGDRDRDKRGLMGAAAERHADRVVLTSDNPRSEDPHQIIEAILAGMIEPDVATVVVDRREAIQHALEASGPGDVIVVAGKGHETTQVIGESTFEFDDRQVVRELAGQGAIS